MILLALKLKSCWKKIQTVVFWWVSFAHSIDMMLKGQFITIDGAQLFVLLYILHCLVIHHHRGNDTEVTPENCCHAYVL